MTRQLTVHTAEITTAAVEVKTLTITGKQVTLAVFRQLQEVPLISDDGTLDGVPWGMVNYHPDKCGDSGSHYHVVWQRGQDLLRSRVDPAPRGCAIRCVEGDRFLSAVAAHQLAGHSTDEWFKGTTPWDDDGYTGVWDAERLNPWGATMRLSMKARSALWDDEKRRSNGDRGASHPDVEFYVKEAERSAVVAEESRRAFLLEVESWGASIEELHMAYVDTSAQESERRQRHFKVREALADLPQLFIAV